MTTLGSHVVNGVKTKYVTYTPTTLRRMDAVGRALCTANALERKSYRRNHSYQAPPFTEQTFVHVHFIYLVTYKNSSQINPSLTSKHNCLT